MEETGEGRLFQTPVEAIHEIVPMLMPPSAWAT